MEEKAEETGRLEIDAALEEPKEDPEGLEVDAAMEQEASWPSPTHGHNPVALNSGRPASMMRLWWMMLNGKLGKEIPN